MQKSVAILLAIIFYYSSGLSKEKAVYALKTAGVTCNIIIDRSGEIIFLTRMYKREVFDAMKKIIFSELARK